MSFKKTTFLSVLFLITYQLSHAQMKRERVNPGGPVETTFWAQTIVGMSTLETLPKHNLNATIMHAFGLATDRPIKEFFGLDIPPNVRLGVDYGLTDRWTLGLGRTTFQKVYDVRSKYALLRQTKSESMPLSLTLKGDLALSTQKDNRPLGDDLSWLLGAPLGKKFSDQLSLQLEPMYAHFNTPVLVGGQQNDLWSLGVGGEYHLSQHFALSFEYYPILGKRNEGTKNAFSLAFNINTGGHVFQLFFASSDWTTEQYILAENNSNFWAGDFRFGFNINRMFWLAGKH